MTINELRPADTPEYMTDAWLSCIHWAISEPEIVAAFRRDTGNRWKPPVCGIDRLVDDATGTDRAFIESFIKWANVNVWGPIDAEAQP